MICEIAKERGQHRNFPRASGFLTVIAPENNTLSRENTKPAGR